MSSPPDVLVIGVGNTLRGDDGVGLAVIAALEARGLPGAQLMSCQGDGLQLIETWKRADRIILIDAVTSGGKAGMVYRFDAIAQALPADLSFSSTHAFGVVEAIELARALDQLPPHIVIYAVEGKNFAIDARLSPEVERALDDLVERVAREVAGNPVV
ncbi:MAG TPA: hydrogenase maturation protease [Ktedonobacteraceae bacterium]|nr:hydrogenase maturation protease [Ktedonobacteraceae bacterium]